jgi:hypothetical protein
MSEDGSARPGGGAERFGILIYTATAGAQGNARLRGRVGTGSRKASRAPHGRLGLVVGTHGIVRADCRAFKSADSPHRTMRSAG